MKNHWNHKIIWNNKKTCHKEEFLFKTFRFYFTFHTFLLFYDLYYFSSFFSLNRERFWAYVEYMEYKFFYIKVSIKIHAVFYAFMWQKKYISFSNLLRLSCLECFTVNMVNVWNEIIFIFDVSRKHVKHFYYWFQIVICLLIFWIFEF